MIAAAICWLLALAFTIAALLFAAGTGTRVEKGDDGGVIAGTIASLGLAAIAVLLWIAGGLIP